MGQKQGNHKGLKQDVALVGLYLGRITTRLGASPWNLLHVNRHSPQPYRPSKSRMDAIDSQEIAQETPAEDVFIAPSIHELQIFAGISYTHHTPIPEVIAKDLSTECVLGVDEAGRGPVLGPHPLSSTSSKPNANAISRPNGLRPPLPPPLLPPLPPRPNPPLR